MAWPRRFPFHTGVAATATAFWVRLWGGLVFSVGQDGVGLWVGVFVCLGRDFCFREKTVSLRTVNMPSWEILNVFSTSQTNNTKEQSEETGWLSIYHILTMKPGVTWRMNEFFNLGNWIDIRNSLEIMYRFFLYRTWFLHSALFLEVILCLRTDQLWRRELRGNNERAFWSHKANTDDHYLSMKTKATFIPTSQDNIPTGAQTATITGNMEHHINTATFTE